MLQITTKTTLRALFFGKKHDEKTKRQASLGALRPAMLSQRENTNNPTCNIGVHASRSQGNLFVGAPQRSTGALYHFVPLQHPSSLHFACGAAAAELALLAFPELQLQRPRKPLVQFATASLPDARPCIIVTCACVQPDPTIVSGAGAEHDLLSLGLIQIAQSRRSARFCFRSMNSFFPQRDRDRPLA